MRPRSLLRLIRLASPSLPVGGYGYSEALESAVDDGRVDDEQSAGDWLLLQFELALARADLPLVAQAFVACEAPDAARLAALHEWHRRTRESAELRLQSEQMGRSLVQWLANGPDADDPRLALVAALAPAPAWPVAYALAGHFSGADADAVLLAFAYGWAENLVQAAIKSVPLGQAAGQRILDRLLDAIPPAAARALRLRDDERQAFAPMHAILSARHETLYSRLFRS
jgi:urease accessory protein